MQLVSVPRPAISFPAPRPAILKLTLAAGLWLLPLGALALAAWSGSGSLWLFEQPIIVFALGLVVASEFFGAVVCALRPGARPSPLRFVRAPLIAASLPICVAFFGLDERALALREGVPLMTHHLVLLALLAYVGFALLGLRGLALPPEPRKEKAPPTVALPTPTPASERAAA